LLVLDRNHDGVIDDGSELFGTATPSAAGGASKDGFAALADLDTNHDGVIDAKDAQFGELRVWVDANADGVSQSDELKSLADLHIAQLNLNASTSGAIDNNNWVRLVSSYTTTDGQSHAMADVWFLTDQSAQASRDAAAAAAKAAQAPLSSQVSALTQAINSYSQPGAAAIPGSGQLTANSNSTGALAADSSLSSKVAELSSQLKQFSQPAGLGSAVDSPGQTDELARRLRSQGMLAAK
jgi:hypothetical protein